MKWNGKSLILGIACTLISGFPALAGNIVGKITYGGTPPPVKAITITKDKEVCSRGSHQDESLVVAADKGIANVVVYLKDAAGAPKMPIPEKTPQIDQRTCKFTPHIQIVPAGGTIEVLNNDGILHNIHTYPKKNPPINRAQPKFKKVMPLTFEEPDTIRIACDVHSWMAGWIIVAPHAWYTVSKEDGTFRIENVPAGTYTVSYWQEKLGSMTAEVTVGASGDAISNLEYPAK